MAPRAFPSMRRLRHDAGEARRVQEVCVDATSTAELISGLLDPFRAALGVSGMIVGSTDPTSAIMSTATLVDSLPISMAEPWMHNEILTKDFNKFRDLHHTGATAVTLGRATQDNPDLSPRYRLNRSLGFGPEMRVTFSTGPACWGVASFVRQAAEPDFDDEALGWIERLRPVISEGLRRTIAVSIPAPSKRIPGVVNLDAAGRVESMTASAKDMLADLWMCPVEGPIYALPGETYMVATIARAQGNSGTAGPAPRTRLRGRSGEWITVRGDCSFTIDGELSGIVLVVEPSRPAEILPLLIASHGLTRREQEVLREMSNGHSTSHIASCLFISQHTVRDHIKSIFAKTGTKSRSELMSLLLNHGS